jgi:glycosyltransferase involved in cell wall biosynthesis
MRAPVPRVSVIIPAYNCEAVLPDALRSVEEQTSRDWEAMVVDDGSTDGTAAAARGYSDRVQLIKSPDNRGLPAARNLGIAKARGELLAFLDADDYWLPSYLADQVELYDDERNTGAPVGIVASDAYLLGPGGFLSGTYSDRVRFPHELTLSRLLAGNPIFVSAMAPKSVIEEAGGFSDECKDGSEDLDMWIRVLELGFRAVRNKRPLAVYRLSADSMSASTAQMSRATKVTYRRALKRGRLNRRQRWIARRELRLHGLVEELMNLNERHGSDQAPSWRARLRVAIRAARVALENPQRWRRGAVGLVRGTGPLRERLTPGRGAILR